MSTNEEQVVTAEVVLDESQLAGFDVDQQQELAKVEDEGILVHIEGVNGLPMYYKDANGQVKPVTMTVAGANSTRFRRAEAALRKRKIKSAKLTGEKLHEDQIVKIAACILDFEGFLAKGQVVDYTQHNVRMILEACPWVMEQIVEVMTDHDRFFKRA